MKMDNRTYDILKYICQYFLPALGTLVFAITSIWHLPYGPEIEGTCLALDTFLAALLGISTYNYKKDIQG
jgi:hypothetical protein